MTRSLEILGRLGVVPIGSLTDKISADISRISNGFTNFVSIADSLVLNSVFDSLVILPHFLVHI